MKDARYEIHSKFYGLLKGNITRNGNTVPVIDEGGDDDIGYPQVMFGEWVEVDYSDKTNFGSEYSFTTKVWDRTDAPTYSRAPIYDIIEQIKSYILVRQGHNANPIDIAGFNVISCLIDNTNSLPKTQTDTHLYWGEQIRWRLLVKEL